MKEWRSQMRARQFLARALVAGCIFAVAGEEARATEYAFSTYGLGQNAFGAGVTPPPGTYVTAVTGVYSAEIGTAVDFGRVVINAGSKVDLFSSALNVLYVPERKLFGGNFGLSVTVPASYIDIAATVGVSSFAASRAVDGWGFSDVTSKAQLGWQQGPLAYTLYVQTVAPTGKYETGFFPITGLNRPGIDTGGAVTWVDKASKLQFNGAAGFTFNFENTATDYKSGDEFHFEWAIGRELSPGFVVGIVGYDYRQVTADSGSGAKLGPFEGRVDAIGPGLSYTTVIGATTPFIFNLRYYREFDAENRWQGNSTIASGTIRF
jgi:hypothetical protein